jgi:hypothetical protein
MIACGSHPQHTLGLFEDYFDLFSVSSYFYATENMKTQYVECGYSIYLKPCVTYKYQISLKIANG